MRMTLLIIPMTLAFSLLARANDIVLTFGAAILFGVLLGAYYLYANRH